MAATSYAHLFGTTAKPKGKQGFPGVGGSGAPASLTQPSQQMMPAPAPTFAQMQSSGQARPAPPPSVIDDGGTVQTGTATGPIGTVGPASTPRTSAPGFPVGRRVATATGPSRAPAGAPAGGGEDDDFLNTLMGTLNRPSPSRYDTDLFKQLREFQQGELEAEYGAQRSRLEEDMARRGLASSSISSGRYGDLAGQQARAMAGIDLNLLERAANTQMSDRLARDQFLLSLVAALSGGDQDLINSLLSGQGGGA